MSLVTLRDDLRLHPGPANPDGSPSWTLEDPLRGQFFRLGWLETELLAHWHLGDCNRISRRINATSTLAVDNSDIERFNHFLGQHQLACIQSDPQRQQLRQQALAPKPQWSRWLLKNYLFLRIPLVRPDRFLTRTLPWVEPLFSRGFFIATALVALLGLYLVARQWDSFTHTFLHFFSLPGALLAGLTLILTKLAHELGHAYSCKRHGGYVATMGVAFMVLWPVLYTDTSSAWRQPKRGPRLQIGAAGVITELCIAAWATLAWSFLPDGMLRSAAFMLATTTWILTLTVNLSPFMRFDGYFLLADLLNVPNLQPRAFALTRWQLRRWLFGLTDTAPEPFSPARKRVLLIYSIGTWIYRLFLFVGIALLVYHFAFKLLGMALFCVEIGYFVLRPLAAELKYWYSRRQEITLNRHTLVTLAVLGTLLALLLIPWRSSIEAPALMRAAGEHNLFVPVGGQLAAIHIAVGDEVNAGQILFRFTAPKLERELTTINARIAVLRWQSHYQRFNVEAAADLPVVREELTAALVRQQSLENQLDTLTVRAPVSGTVVDLNAPPNIGEWLSKGMWLATLVSAEGARVEAYVDERNLARIAPGNRATFYPEQLSQPPLELTLNRREQTPTRTLSAVPELASTNGGNIASRMERDQVPVAEQAIYRVQLAPTSDLATPRQALRGTVVISGQKQSLISRMWQSVMAVLIRETAF